LTLPQVISDPEAIAYDPVRNVFYVSGGFSADIFVVSRDGKTILDTITVLEGFDNPISNVHVRPKALTLAPSSDPNDDLSVMSLWVADYGADQVMDGRIFEVKLTNPLFGARRDVVNFNQVVDRNYYGSQYDALSGNDTVMLATSTAAASKAGFDPTHTFNGGDGNDIILGRALNDHISGGNGDDYVRGGAGNDNLAGDANADTLSGGLGNDLLDGGADADTVNYQEALGAVRVNLSLGTATGDGTDTLINIEHVVGSSFKDFI
jgi:Ca2+-binding RTX toxin-like protein